MQRVAEGKKYVEREIATDLAIKQFSGDGDVLDRLTLREMEILRLLGEGKSMMAIANTLGVAYKTIANSCSTMKNKLAVERTARPHSHGYRDEKELSSKAPTRSGTFSLKLWEAIL